MNIQEVIQIGYEQQSCNDEMLVDFGDALRIYKERNPEVVLTIDDVEAAAIAWQNEFKEIIDIEWYRRNIQYLR